MKTLEIEPINKLLMARKILLVCGILYLNPPKNTPSIAEGLGGDEFGIVGASPTIN